jgi:gamma-glutamyltranspeptidase
MGIVWISLIHGLRLFAVKYSIRAYDAYQQFGIEKLRKLFTTKIKFGDTGTEVTKEKLDEKIEESSESSSSSSSSKSLSVIQEEEEKEE